MPEAAPADVELVDDTAAAATELEPVPDPVPEVPEVPAAAAVAESQSAPADAAVAESDPLVAGALRTIVIPDHDSQFWDAVAGQLADEPQLRLRPRAAVRPITQPPPIIDDRLPFDDSDLRPRSRVAGRRRRRRVVVWLVAIALSALIIGTALQDRGDETDDVRSGDSTTTTTQPAQAPGGGSTSAPPPASPVDPAAGLTPNGVGPLTVGTSVRDLLNSGTPAVVVDQPTFTGSAGTCFDATVTGVGDLLLRLRSPQPGQGVADPADGLLGTVAVDAQLGSMRATETGIALGATEDQVRAAYPDGLTETDHPYTPGGHVFTYVPPDSGNGIAFMTDGATVTSIVVGAVDLIGYPEGCP